MSYRAVTVLRLTVLPQVHYSVGKIIQNHAEVFMGFSATGFSANALHSTDRWLAWQSDVVTIVRRQLREVLPNIQPDDFDWEAWRCYFNEGHLPRAAVCHAMSFDCADQDIDTMDGLAAKINSRFVID